MELLIILLLIFYALGMFYLAGQAYSYSKENNEKIDRILKLLGDNNVVSGENHDNNSKDNINMNDSSNDQ